MYIEWVLCVLDRDSNFSEEVEVRGSRSESEGRTSSGGASGITTHTLFASNSFAFVLAAATHFKHYHSRTSVLFCCTSVVGETPRIALVVRTKSHRNRLGDRQDQSVLSDKATRRKPERFKPSVMATTASASVHPSPPCCSACGAPTRAKTAAASRAVVKCASRPAANYCCFPPRAVAVARRALKVCNPACRARVGTCRRSNRPSNGSRVRTVTMKVAMFRISSRNKRISAATAHPKHPKISWNGSRPTVPPIACPRFWPTADPSKRRS